MTADDDIDRPNAVDRRWEELAEELQFHQLAIARRQAEGWRNGLAGCATLLAAVTLVKGRPDFDKLAGLWRYAPIVLLLLGFALLLAAFLIALRAAHGRPGTLILGDGESLRTWTEQEAARIGRLLPRAAIFAVVALTAVLSSAVVTWLAPVAR